MPFLSLVHLRELRCPLCSKEIAAPGARSFIVDGDGNPVHFAEERPPQEMTVALQCRNGHTTEISVPNEIAAEETLATPEDAPIAADAVLVSVMPEK